MLTQDRFFIGPGSWEVARNRVSEVGDVIHYHGHAFDHPTIIRLGRWRLRTRVKIGVAHGQRLWRESEQELSSPGLSGDLLPEFAHIAAGDEHEFTLLDLERGRGELWCLWPNGWNSK